MAARRKKRPLRPRVPSRVKKRTRRPRSQHENELLGLALLALGLVLAAILYLGLDGGAVGSWLADVLDRGGRQRRLVLPVALVALGGLLLARSDLLEVRPFRLGVGVSFLGLMTLLGKDIGGWVGMAIGGTVAALIGTDRRGDHRRRAARRGALARDRRVNGRDPRRTGHVDEARRHRAQAARSSGRRASRRRRRTSTRAARRRDGRPSTRSSTGRRPIPTWSVADRSEESAGS